ncbi:MAG: 2Fe-2S iron-sulfur cluster-binding protein, partial [Candidatus Eisenbacteria bacterium]
MPIRARINDVEVTVEPGTTILRAASDAGVYVPHLCYHRSLSIRGSCRVCLVEVEGTPKLQPACSTAVCDGMVVKTDSPAVCEARSGVLELLLVNHPLDCPVCDKGGECKLQDYVFWYGRGRGRYRFEKRTFPRQDIGPFVVRDMNRCIHCTRCIRFVSEFTMSEDIGVFGRGDSTSIGTHPGEALRSPFSGNVTEICPVGALTDRTFRFKARVWDLEDVPSACPLCSAGCLLSLQTEDGRLRRVKSRGASRIPWICDMGRFAFASSREKGRLPVLKEDGGDLEVPWEVALGTVAGRFRVVSKESGPESLGLYATPLATNEELFALRHAFADVLGTGSVGFSTGTVWPKSEEEEKVLGAAL